MSWQFVNMTKGTGALTATVKENGLGEPCSNTE